MVNILTKVFFNIFDFDGETVAGGTNFYEAFNEVCFIYLGYGTINYLRPSPVKVGLR